MINADVLLASSGWLILGSPVFALRLKIVSFPLSSEFFVGYKQNVLMTAQSPQKWWFTLIRSAVSQTWGQCQPNYEKTTALICCQLPNDFLTSVLSDVFERLVTVRLGRFMERIGVLPITSLLIGKVLGTCDGLL